MLCAGINPAFESKTMTDTPEQPVLAPVTPQSADTSSEIEHILIEAYRRRAAGIRRSENSLRSAGPEMRRSDHAGLSAELKFGGYGDNGTTMVPRGLRVRRTRVRCCDSGLADRTADDAATAQHIAAHANLARRATHGSGTRGASAGIRVG